MDLLLQKAAPYPQLTPLSNSHWKSAFDDENRHRIYLLLCAVFRRALSSKFRLRFSDLKAEDFVRTVEFRSFQAASNDIAYVHSLIYRFASLVGLNRVLRDVPSDCPVDILYQQIPEITHILQDDRIILLGDDLISLVTSDVEKFYGIHTWISQTAENGHFLLKNQKVRDLLSDARYIARQLVKGGGVEQISSYAQRALEMMNLRKSLDQINQVMTSVVPDENFARELNELLKATLLRRATRDNLDAHLKPGNTTICPHIYRELLDIIEEWSICRVNVLRRLVAPAPISDQPRFQPLYGNSSTWDTSSDLSINSRPPMSQIPPSDQSLRRQH